MSEPKVFDHLLLGAGAMKAGTTWIFDVLHRHPEIHFCREKEIHYLYARHVNPGLLSDKNRMRRAKDYLYFDPEVSSKPVLQKRVEWVANWLKGPVDDDWFNSLFLQKGAATWVADFSNMNALVPEEGWAALHARTEKLRVMYTLREPLDRLWSHLRFHLKMHGKTSILGEWTLDDMEHHIRHEPHYLPHSDYLAAITRMQNALPPECLHINFFDRIPREPRAFIVDIEQFLGVEHFELADDMVTRVVNPSPPQPMPDGFAERFAEDVKRQVEGLRALGIAVPDSWG